MEKINDAEMSGKDYELLNNIEQSLTQLSLNSRDLYKEQLESLHIISSLGQDAFIVLPTGSGKSTLFHVAPFLVSPTEPTLVLIIMPLDALIDQQVSKLQLAGFRCKTIRNKCDAEVVLGSDIITHAIMTPESLESHILPVAEAEYQSVSRITHVFVDESHLVYSWGKKKGKELQAFRESYGQIARLRVIQPAAGFIALTATATAAVEQSSCQMLQMGSYMTVRKSPDKPNLRYSVVKTGEELETNFAWLMKELQSNQCVKTIVFFSQIAHIANVYRHLVNKCPHNSVKMFHKNISDEGKQFVIDRFSTSQETELRCVLASSAFSMGMHIPEVSRVVHYGAPSSMDMYVQESGRAGRDGQLADCVILYHRYALSGETTSEVKTYMKGSTCRRNQIMSTFNLSSSFSGRLLCCDICCQGYVCCSCPLQVQCDHTDNQSCYCVRWCAVVGLRNSFTVATSQESRLKVRSKVPSSMLTQFERDIRHLGSESRTLPVSTIYPELVQKLLSEHEYLDSIQDVMDLGAFSVNDASSILSIINQYTEDLDMNESMSALNLDSDSN